MAARLLHNLDTVHLTLHRLEACRANLANSTSLSDAFPQDAAHRQSLQEQHEQYVPTGFVEERPALSLQLTAAREQLLEAGAGLLVEDPDEVVKAAVAATEVVSNVLGLVTGGEKLEVHQGVLAVITEAARALAKLQHGQVKRAAAASAIAKEAENASRAAQAAMEAGKAAGMAVWAASIGGPDLMRELRGAQEEAMRAAEAAAEDAWAAEQAARDALAAAAAAHELQAPKQAGQVVLEVATACTSQQAVIAEQALYQLSRSSPDAASASGTCCLRPAAPSGICSPQRGAITAAGSDAVHAIKEVPRITATTAEAATGAAAPAADGAAATAPPDDVRPGDSGGSQPGSAASRRPSGQVTAPLPVTGQPEPEGYSTGTRGPSRGAAPGANCAATAPSASQAALGARSAAVTPVQAGLQAAEAMGSVSAAPRPTAVFAPGPGVYCSGVHIGSIRTAGRANSPAVAQPDCTAFDELHALVEELDFTARFITPDGGLPPNVLETAAFLALNVLESAPPAAVRRALSAAPRPGIMELVSLAVRRAADGPCSEPAADPAAALARRDDWHQWLLLLRACLRILEAQVSSALHFPMDVVHGRRTDAFVETVLRTDLLPALSRVSAAAAAAAAAFSCGGDDDKSGSGGGRSICGVEELNAWGLAVASTCRFLLSLRGLVVEPSASPVPGLLPPPLRLQLVGAVRESYALEHSARAVMALLGPAPCHEALGAEELDQLADSLAGLLELACTAVLMPEDEAPGGPYGGAPGALTRRRLPTLASSSPCLQHLLLLHTLAQLCAVDGGTDYGLPPGAALPALTEWDGAIRPVWLGRKQLDPGTNGNAEEEDLEPISLVPAYISRALDSWGDRRITQKSALPCSRRALWALCMRLVACAQAPTEPPICGLGSRVRRVRFSHPIQMELAALRAALQLTSGSPAVGSMRDLWAPVVQAVNRLTGSSRYATYAVEALELVFGATLPWQALGRALPAEPPADAAAALASGYVACMEATLRRHGRLPCSPSAVAADCISIADRLLKGVHGWHGLLAYGEPRSLASAIATGAKVLRRGLAEAAKADSYCEEEDFPALFGGVGDARWHLENALTDFEDTLVFARVLAVLFVREDTQTGDRHWWRKRGGAAQSLDGAGGDGATPGQPGAVEASAPDASVGDGDEGVTSGSGGVGSSGGDANNRGGLPPSQQLLLLSSWALARCLPVLAQGVLALPDPLASMCVSGARCALLPWVPRLILAYMDCRAAAVEAAARAAAALTETDKRAAAADAATAEAAANSWRRLLLQDMQLTRLLIVTAHDALQRRCAMWGSDIDSLVDAVLHFAVAFPEEARSVLHSPAVDEVNYGLTLLQALQRSSSAADYEAARLFVHVITTVGAGRPPTASMIARLRNVDYRAGIGADCKYGQEAAAAVDRALRVAPLLLPPPDVAAALLRLPLCANPGCTNLEGDSEAGLRLSGCRRCGGAVAYCSKECQVAHWRAGHREECKPCEAATE